MKSKDRRLSRNIAKKVGHHEFQAAPAEEEQRLLQGQLWQQKLELREAHQRSLTDGRITQISEFYLRHYGKTNIHRGSEHFYGTFWPSTGIAK